MAFQRSNSARLDHSRWRLDHQGLLIACGLPSEVVASDRRWRYVLLHADDYPGTGWDVSWISPQQAADLLAALERDLPNPTGFDLLRRLQERARCSGPAEPGS